MKKLSTILIIFISSVVATIAQNDQRFVIKTVKGINDYIELNENSLIIGNESEITPTSFISKQLGVGESGGIEFDVTLYQTTDAFSVGFRTSDNKLYAFNFANNEVKIFNNGTLQAPTSVITNSNGKFFINKVGNNLKFFFGLTQVGTITIGSTVSLSAEFISTNSIQANIDLRFKKPSHSEAVEGETYLIPNREIAGGYVKLKDDIIRFQYKEDYNTLEDDVRIKIFDKKHTLIAEKKITDNKLGTNFRQYNISTLSLNRNDLYLLELTANKGEQYYVRFLPNGGNPIQPPLVIPPIVNATSIPNVTIACLSQMPTQNPTATDGYNITEISLTYREERMMKAGCSNCSEKVLRIWEGQDSKCYPLKIVQVVTVNDDIPPTISVPSPVTINYNQPIPAFIATANDNCGNVTIKEEQIISYNSIGEVITYNWIATDECGNSSSNKSTITIQDLQCPLINLASVPDDKIVGDMFECISTPVISAIISGSGAGARGIPNPTTTTPQKPTKKAPKNSTINCTCNGKVLTGVDETEPKIEAIVECLKNDITPVATDDYDNSLDLKIEYTIECQPGKCGYYVFKKWIFTDDTGKWSSYTQKITVQSPSFAPVTPVGVYSACPSL